MKLAYLIEKFPKLSETFVWREVAALEHHGFAPVIFRLADGDEVADDVVQAAAARAITLPSPMSAAACGGILRHGLRHPVRAAFGALAAGAGALEDLRHARELRHLGRSFLLAEHLQRRGITHLHVHFASLPASIGWLAARLAGIDFSISVHAWDIYAQRFLMRPKLREARRVVFCHQAALDFALEHYPFLRPRRTVLVHHNLPWRRYPMWTDATDRFAGPLRILTIGRLTPKKGFDVLLRAVAELRRRKVDVVLTLIGDGEERARLEAQAAELGLAGHVRFAGRLPHERVLQHFADATAFALPCRVLPSGDRDGIPNVLLEAMASGLPVVTSDLPGPAEAVRHDIEGLLVPVESPGAVADALARLAQDRDLAARLGQAGRTRVQQMFDPDVNTEKLVAVFRELADR